jgi:hypothetical protein
MSMLILFGRCVAEENIIFLRLQVFSVDPFALSFELQRFSKDRSDARSQRHGESTPERNPRRGANHRRTTYLRSERSKHRKK